MIWFVPQDGEKLPSGKNIGFVPLHNKIFNWLFKELNKSCLTCSKLLIQTLLCSIDAHQTRKECMVRHAQSDINQLLLSNRVQETISKVTDIFSVDSCLSTDPNIDQCFTNFIRVCELKSQRKHICEDKTRLAAYAQVQYFCSFILQNFSDLKHQR